MELYLHIYSNLSTAYCTLRTLKTWNFFPGFCAFYPKFIFGMIRSTLVLRKLQIKQKVLCFLSNFGRSGCQQNFFIVSFSYNSLSEIHVSRVNIKIICLQDPVHHHHPHLHLVLSNFLDLLGLHDPILDAFFVRPMCNTNSANQSLLNFLTVTILYQQHTLQDPHYIILLPFFVSPNLGPSLIFSTFSQ